MKGITYFNALEAARARCNSIRDMRGTEFGIAVQVDPLARAWQRYDRMVRKCKYRVRVMLGAKPYQEPICLVCGLPMSICECKRRGWSKE
jgi:4-aminobutyrate aminotransferase-like enzyme